MDKLRIDSWIGGLSKRRIGYGGLIHDYMVALREGWVNGGLIHGLVDGPREG